MIKAAFFDVDGTLIPRGGGLLSDALREDLLALRAAGIKLFLATGRSPRDLENTGMLRDVVFDAYLTMNGNRCFDADGLYRSVTIDRGDLEAACGVLREHPELIAIMETERGNFLNRTDESLTALFREIHTPAYPVRPPEAALNESTYQFVPLLRPGHASLYSHPLASLRDRCDTDRRGEGGRRPCNSGAVRAGARGDDRLRGRRE